MPKCVVFSERAFTSILVETQEKIRTETGGVFLGYRKGDVWYVIESIDPGPNSVFQPAYFEYDQDYINHLINKVSRLYSLQLELIGLWHRHPGSYDSFSGTDDGTNTKYAELNEQGAISTLVNIDPQFRLTVYTVTLPLKYEKIKYVVGDSYIPQEMLTLRNSAYLQQQMEVSSTQQVVPNSLKHKWLTTKRTKGGEIISRKPTQKIELKEFSFHEVIYWFLRQRTYSDIKSPSIKLPKEDEGDAVMYTLEKLDDDLKFLTQLGVECQMSISPTGSLVLKENEPSAKTHPRFELSFGSQDNEILFSFNECCYKYHPGLFKDAYLEFLSKEGADH